MSTKKAIPPLVKAQLERYNDKLKRAKTVALSKKKLDANFHGFNELVNPVTQERYADLSVSAKMKRLNNWLKAHDRDYWNDHYAEGVTGAVSTASTSKSRDEKGKSVVAQKPQAQPKALSYWVCSPATSKVQIFLPDKDGVSAVISTIDFADSLKPLRPEDRLASVLLEVDIIGGNAVDKGRVTCLPKGEKVDVGHFLASKYGCINLVAGVNKIFFKSKEGAVTIEDLLGDEQICMYRVDDSCVVYIRKWANYEMVVPSTAPASDGKVSSLFIG